MSTTTKTVAQQVAETFPLDVDFHVQHRLLENGPYRHIKWRANSTSKHWFELISAPGSLTIRGDMGTYVFAGADDMFTSVFDASPDGQVDPRSWTQHLIATDSRQHGVASHEYSTLTAHDTVASAVTAYLNGTKDDDLLWAVREEVLIHVDSEQDLRKAASQFRYDDLTFDDAWQWDLNEYSYKYLWCIHAVRWGINDYHTAIKAGQGPV